MNSVTQECYFSLDKKDDVIPKIKPVRRFYERPVSIWWVRRKDVEDLQA